MTNAQVWKKAATCVTFFAVTVVCLGCGENKPGTEGGGDGTKVSFTGRKCPTGPPQHHRIEIVANSAVFKDPADKALVVCENDMVSWFISNGSGAIDVNFTDTFAKDLFGTVSFSSNPANTQSETGKGTVQSQDHHRGQVYKYSIVVKDSSGKQQGNLDPHVIPM
jgi:hypothetical protein